MPVFTEAGGFGLGPLAWSNAMMYHNGQIPQAFVTSLYQAALGRTPGAGELMGWTNQIAAGTPPATILLGIGNSTEAAGRLAPAV